MEPMQDQGAHHPALLSHRRRDLALVGGIASALLVGVWAAGEVSGAVAAGLIAALGITLLAVERWHQPEAGAATEQSRHLASAPAAMASASGRGLGYKARVLLDELPDAILVLDDEGRLVLANRAACARFVGEGYERKFLSSTMRRPAVLEAVQRVRETLRSEEVEFYDLVPVERSFTAYVAPLIDTTAPASEILVVVRDTTSAKAVEKMRADFVANASHELRTPLSSLIGFIDTLRGHAREDAGAREKFLSIMADQAGRMGRLIDDLLSLSRIELNEHVPPQGVIDLGRVVNDVVDAMHPLAREAGVTLNVQIDKSLPRVIGSRDELVQVLQNLLDNAIKYGRQDSQVEIVAARGAPPFIATGLVGPSCYVSVTDHGEGIAREHIPRLTERFYRVDVKRSRERGGTGLGLAIVKHIVSRHRGKLHIKSDPGLGSVFTVVLPQAVGTTLQPPSADGALPPLGPSGGDDASVAKSL